MTGRFYVRSDKWRKRVAETTEAQQSIDWVRERLQNWSENGNHAELCKHIRKVLWLADMARLLNDENDSVKEQLYHFREAKRAGLEGLKWELEMAAAKCVRLIEQ